MVVDAAEIDRVFHALGDATRRDLLVRAIDEELSVSALARRYAMSLPAVQKHVAVLERAGLVTRSRVGRETRVRAERGRIQAARELLDSYEQLWRHRIAAMDELLATDDPAPAGAAAGAAAPSRNPTTPGRG